MLVLCVFEVLINARRGVLLAVDAIADWLVGLVSWRCLNLELLVDVLGVLKLHTSVTCGRPDLSLALRLRRVYLICWNLFGTVLERRRLEEEVVHLLADHVVLLAHIRRHHVFRGFVGLVDGGIGVAVSLSFVQVPAAFLPMTDRDLRSIHIVDTALAVGLVPCRIRLGLACYVCRFLLVLPNEKGNIFSVLVLRDHCVSPCRRHVHREAAGARPVMLVIVGGLRQPIDSQVDILQLLRFLQSLL